MTIYGRIVDGVLVESGELPPSAVVPSTNKVIDDLANTGRKWMNAAGWYDLSEVVLEDITDDVTKQEALAAAIAEATSGSTDRTDLIDKIHALMATGRGANWQWIDRFCHPQVAQISYVAQHSPTAGALWPGLATADKAEALQLGVSYLMAEVIRLSQFADLLLDADGIAQLIASDAELVVPPDR